MDVCRECCVLSGGSLCDVLITRPEESYRLWCVVVCNLETSWMWRPWPTGGLSRQNQNIAKNRLSKYKVRKSFTNWSYPSLRMFVWNRFLLVKYSAFELHWKDSFLKKHRRYINTPSAFTRICFFVFYSHTSLPPFCVLFSSLTLQSASKHPQNNNKCASFNVTSTKPLSPHTYLSPLLLVHEDKNNKLNPIRPYSRSINQSPGRVMTPT
jgi:hypothetical protein